MKMPDADPITKVLKALLPDCPDLANAESATSLTDATVYVAPCVDDAGNPIAAIAADLNAALHLAGKLMMLPPGGLEDQAKAGKLEDALYDALSEVFNNLAKTMNCVAGNPHLVSRPVRDGATLAGELDWLGKPSVTQEYGADFVVGGGRLIFAAK